MKLSDLTKRCLTGLALGALFGLVLSVAVAAAFQFSGSVGTSSVPTLAILALLTAFCAVSGLLYAWSGHTKS